MLKAGHTYSRCLVVVRGHMVLVLGVVLGKVEYVKVMVVSELKSMFY